MPDEYENIGTDSKYVEYALETAEEDIDSAIESAPTVSHHATDEEALISNRKHARAILNMCVFIAANWNSHAFIEEEVREYLNNREKWCEEISAAMTKLKDERMENRRRD